MNVSSIVVQARAEHIEALVKTFTECDYCDYHFHDEALGKIVLTVEGEGIAEEIEKVKRIKNVPHVVSADMMMAYSEDELDREREKFVGKDAVPFVLNDLSVRAEDIVYRGDLKKKEV
ncbi:MAG: chaperone NapD [Campylobacterales bacterium]|nr:chaperone NapD [Campylobacterales bacterium]